METFGKTVGNGRKRSETVGNMIRPKLVQPAFLKISISAQHRATIFFFEGPKVSLRGNGWKQSEIAPSLGKKNMFLHNVQTFCMNMLQNNYFFAEHKHHRSN